MPQAGRSVTRIQDQDDFGSAPGAGNDGYFIAWINGSSEFQLVEVSVLTVDTKNNLLALTPTTDTFGFASDTPNRLYIYSVSAGTWYQSSLPFYSEILAQDMGSSQDNPLMGIWQDAIDSKTLTRVKFGMAADDEDATVRYNYDLDRLQIYYESAWNTVVAGFTFREDTTGRLEHKPVGHLIYYWIPGGRSVDIGIDGNPLAWLWQGANNIGARQTPPIIDGGSV